MLGALVVASTVGLSAHAEAPAPVDADVTRYAELARTKKGVGAYAALRRLWRRWEEADPSQIEEALASVESSGSAEPAVRAYAGMLHAYARRRRGDLDGAKRRLAKLGYVDRWLIVGPFDNEEKGSLNTAFGPEDDLSQPLVLGKAYEGKERPVAWRKVPAALASFGWLDLGNLIRPSEKVCGYATTFVRSRAGKTSTATLWVGTSGAFRAFFNAQEVLADPGYRSVEADRWAARLELRPGWNRLTVKVCGDEEGPVLTARLAGPDGAPSDDLEASHDLAFAEPASKNTRARAAKVEAPKGVKVVSKGDPYAKGASEKAAAVAVAPQAVGGALMRLAAVVADKKSNVDEVEAMARYLALTGGDERGKHLARDLAARAAELAPSTSRLLFAGELAEDRNARADWIARARAALAPGEDEKPVLLSEALHARGGANFRDATPYFDRLLAKDPSHIAAILGRAELYAEAGLRHSALAALEEGVRRAPSALSLLRALAAQYRAVGRQTDAEEVERRYAARRADDVAWLRAQLEDAVARRDKPATVRAAERAMAVDPDAFPTIDVAARALRAMGEEPRAIALYERRLEVAPDDVDAIRALADLHGESGRREPQLSLLRRLLVLRPQAKDVREYLERQQPPKVRKDEAYAWDDVKLRELAKEAPPPGVPKRTLRDLQVTTVFQNGLASRFHQLVFQPLTEEAAAGARQFAFGYQAGREVVDIRAARVFRANGKIDESVETGDGPADNPAIAMYTSQRTFYVQLPRLAAGDVVELRYRVEEVTPRNEFGDSFSETAPLGALEPLRSLEYVLLAPREKKLRFRAPAGFTVDERDDEGFHAWRVRAEHLAPITQEPAMPPLAELVPTVSVSSFATWDDVGKWYWGLAKDQLDADDEVRKKVAELTKGLTTDDQKVRAVYAFVVQRTRYVALEFGIEGFKPRRCALTLSRGWGDCKDKATVIVTMLRELGIDAHLVLVRSALRGDAATEPPSYALFDHAIAYVPKLDLFLDGTAEYTGSRELPAFVRGQPALIVTASGSKLVRIPDPPSEATARTRHVEVTVPDAQGPATLDLRVEATGAIAADFRQRFHARATQKGRVLEDFGPAFGGLSVVEKGIDVSDLEDVESPVKIRVQGKALGITRRSEGELSFVAAPSTGLVERYASLSTRHHPVRIPFAHTLDDTWTVKLPASAQLKHAPESKRIESPFGRLEITVEQQPGKLVARSKLRVDKTRIAPSEYGAFRKFCEDVDRALGERVVIARLSAASTKKRAAGSPG